MDQYEIIERAILNCFYIEPRLLEITKLESKHFKKNHRLFNLFKFNYNKYKKLDCALISSYCDDPAKACDYIADIIDTTSIVKNYPLYEKRLLELYTEFHNISEIYKFAKLLYNRDIDIEQFKREINYIIGE